MMTRLDNIIADVATRYNVTNKTNVRICRAQRRYKWNGHSVYGNKRNQCKSKISFNPLKGL